MADENNNTVKNPINDFNNYIQYVDQQLVFRGNTLSEWYDKIVFPNLTEFLNKDEVSALNTIAVNYSEIIYKNMAISKNTLTAAKAKHQSDIQKFKVDLIDSLENTPTTTTFKKKAPTSDMLEARASVACHPQFQTVILAEIVYDFWKCQVDRLQLFNSRLTSLNIAKHNDEKYSNQSIS